MDKQFTASEVREYANYDDSPEREMLNAFADLLEAREKAVPVAWVNPDDLANPVFAGVNVAKATHPDLGRHYTQPLYTHPAPTDAERLAEALRAKIKEWRGAYHHVTEFDRGRRNGFLAACDSLERLLSAQAQPHDLIKTGDADADPSICDVTGEVVLAYCRRCKQGEGDLTDNCPGQPPAASVTDVDAMVTRFLGWKLPKDFAPDAGISFKPMPDEYMPHCWPTGTNLFHAGQAKEMILHMLGDAFRPLTEQQAIRLANKDVPEIGENVSGNAVIAFVKAVEASHGIRDAAAQENRND